ncbi:uncharacterized protein LOC124893422 [Capsicum annuum]|uniref:uncharacterized protein LOC124893422 n=1 Tax=Capsicum annuum TaxID=4072 RepID=UPI001FB161A3|nr:uncharacterized protein LOC124893422 [Capsicum annuum]
MNLIREFEMKRMKESEIIKDYADQPLDLANKVRLFGKDFIDERIAQKILITLPKKYEATISFLENSKNLSSITLAELVNTLHALEQRRIMRKEGSVEDVKCNKCGQLGHVERVCKSQMQQEEAKAAVNQYGEEQFGCTNHMTSDQKLFKELDRFVISKVKIGNGEYLDAKGKGIITIQSPTGLKLTTSVFFVSDLDQNLLIVGQLLENGFKVLFEEKSCVIKDFVNTEMFKVKIRGRSFSLNLLDEKQATNARLENDSELCNKIFECYHHDAILFMKENQLAEGFSSLKKIYLLVKLVSMGSKQGFLFRIHHGGQRISYNLFT